MRRGLDWPLRMLSVGRTGRRRCASAARVGIHTQMRPVDTSAALSSVSDVRQVESMEPLTPRGGFQDRSM